MLPGHVFIKFVKTENALQMLPFANSFIYKNYVYMTMSKGTILFVYKLYLLNYI